MATSIDVPGPAAAFYDLHAPMVIVRGDCDKECDGSRHHDSAKDSIEKHASHFVPFDPSVIAARLQIGLALCDLFQASRANPMLTTNEHECTLMLLPRPFVATANPYSAQSDAYQTAHRARNALPEAAASLQAGSQ